MSVDIATIATMVLCIALYIVRHCISGTVSIAVRRAGLPLEISILTACRYIIGASLPFLLFSSSRPYTESGITHLFKFGMSPFKFPAIALIIWVAWLVA